MPHRRIEHWQPTELLEVLDRVGQQASGEHHQQHADDSEEPRQIEPVAKPVDHEGDTPSPPPRPMSAPVSAPAVDVEKMIARVNTTVSRPSRPTAWKASSPSPHLARPSSAASARSRSSFDNDRACLRIQNVM